MITTRSIADLVAARRSCRTYRPLPLAVDDRQYLVDAMRSLPRPPFGGSARFALAAAVPGDSDALKGLGTYGFIKHPAGFIIGAAHDTAAPGVLEDFGYLMECLVLMATDRDLGTCWLGGSFTKSSFATRIAAVAGETVPAVIALGYADDQRVMERLLRMGAGADHRLPPEDLFFDGDFDHPLPRGAAGLLEGPLELVRRAPSASNRQPWRVVAASQGRWHFYCQRSAGYRTRNQALFGVEDMQRIDMGIALCHFELGCRELNRAGRWLCEDPGIGRLPGDCWYVMTWVGER